MVAQHYRWDFVGLSTDTKPTPQTSEKVVDGSTFYCSDTSKLYVYCKDNWYERKALGGGGTTYTAGDGIDITNDTISVDTTTIQPKLTAGTNITISDQNVISASGGGGVKELTSADYNWPVSDPEGIAYWLLSDGVYKTTSGVRFYYNNLTSSWDAVERVFIVETDTSPYKVATSIQPNKIKYYKNNSTDGSSVSGYPYVVLTSHDIVNTTGTNQSSVMSQNAVTSMVFADPDTRNNIQIGSGATAKSGNSDIVIGLNARNLGNYVGIAIGENAVNNGANSIAIGRSSFTDSVQGAIALGFGAHATQQGEMNIGASSNLGYNNTNYRVIGGVHDGQNAHDVATVAQGNTLSTSAPTTSTEGVLGQLYTDTSNMHTYQCTAISGDTYTWTQRW